MTGKLPRLSRTFADVLLAGAVLLIEVALALLVDDGGRRPDALGWTLLVLLTAPLVDRRRWPMGSVTVLIAITAVYHSMDYNHVAPLAAAFVSLFTVAVLGPPVRTLIIGTAVVALVVGIMTNSASGHQALEALRSSGWILLVLALGEAVRLQRAHVASIVERAERAEHTREEEAARRVAEERLRIARDLHDLLAHSITLIGVQASVAAHLLGTTPEKMDARAVGGALDIITGACGRARAELRATLEVLRGEGGPPDGEGPDEGRSGLPALRGVRDLAESARLAGLRVELRMDEGLDGDESEVPAAVGAAAYRIVQESLTNVVKHARDAGTAQVRISRNGAGEVLRVEITDDGSADVAANGSAAGAVPAARSGGYGIIGMRERARSVGGSLKVGARGGPAGGFGVTAVLPLRTPENGRVRGTGGSGADEVAHSETVAGEGR